MFQRLLAIQAQDLGEIWRTYQLYGEAAEGKARNDRQHKQEGKQRATEQNFIDLPIAV